MKLIILLLFPIKLYAGFSEVSDQELYDYRLPTPKRSLQIKNVKRKDRNQDINTLKQLLQQDEKIAELLERQEKTLIVRKAKAKINALTRVKGTLLNSVLAMNIRPSKFIIRLDGDQEEIDGSEIRCLGYSFQKRVPAHCDLLVIEGEEYQVDIDIWDLDGAEGIIADYFYSGEEKAFLTSSLASFLQGALDVAKTRISTPFGNIDKNTAKNKLFGGFIGVAENAKGKIIESGEQNLTISYVNSGKEVLVFFNQSLNLEKDK